MRAAGGARGGETARVFTVVLLAYSLGVYADDRARAAVLQSALLPSNLGEFEGLDLYIGYAPADLTRGLGSDWYDVMTLPAGEVYLAVGELMGRDLASVEDMGQLLSAGRALALQGLPPSRVLAELNGLLRDASHSDLATMAVAIYDPEAGTVSHSAAGHSAGRAAQGRHRGGARTLRCAGPTLGSAAEAGYADGTVPVDRGDVLVMYTDGLVRSAPAGSAQARRAIAKWDVPPRCPVRVLMHRVRSHAASAGALNTIRHCDDLIAADFRQGAEGRLFPPGVPSRVRASVVIKCGTARGLSGRPSATHGGLREFPAAPCSTMQHPTGRRGQRSGGAAMAVRAGPSGRPPSSPFCR